MDANPDRSARDVRLHGAGLGRGVRRALHDHGYDAMAEVGLASRRRVDVMALGADGTILVVEIKSSLEDFRSDRKWREYLVYCDLFYFAVPENFPREALPSDCGLMVADYHGAVIAREAPYRRLHAVRRRAVILNFARTAARRLGRLDGVHPDARPRHGINAGTRLL